MINNPIVIKNEEALKLIDSKKAVILMFGLKDDSVTKHALRRLTHLIESYAVKIYYLECIDDVIDTFCISKVPHFRFYDKGGEVKCITGMLESTDL